MLRYLFYYLISQCSVTLAASQFAIPISAFFRSLCTLVSKWTYQANAKTKGWDQNYFTQIGLEDLVTDQCAKIGILKKYFYLVLHWLQNKRKALFA